jgi:hypothetical protein
MLLYRIAIENWNWGGSNTGQGIPEPTDAGAGPVTGQKQIC